MADRIGIVGTRSWPEPSAVEALVAELPEGTVVVSGASGVVDITAARAARARGLDVVEYPAEWERYGKAAGPLRNGLIAADCTRLVAFWEGASRGTADVVAQACSLGRPVLAHRRARHPEPRPLRAAPLRFYTARVSYAGEDRLDVSRKGADAHARDHQGDPGLGGPFAPSWAILGPALKARSAEGALTEKVWREYNDAYGEEMGRLSLSEWGSLLRGLSLATLVCYCTDASRCHRTVLAELLVRRGAEYLGERHA